MIFCIVSYVISTKWAIQHDTLVIHQSQRTMHIACYFTLTNVLTSFNAIHYNSPLSVSRCWKTDPAPLQRYDFLLMILGDGGCPQWMLWCSLTLPLLYQLVTTRLFLFLAAGEESQLLAKDLLLVQHLLVVHVLEQIRIINAVSSQKLSICHLECLPDRLSYQLRLQTTAYIHITTTTTPAQRPLFQDNLGKSVPER